MKRVGILCLILCFFCCKGMAEEHAGVDLDSLGEEFFSLPCIPSLECTLALVSEDLITDNVTILSIMPTLSLREGAEGWNVSVIYQNNDSCELRHGYFYVHGDDTRTNVIKYPSSPYTEIAYSIQNPVQKALIADQVDVWEQTYGPWYFWPLDIKMSFFSQYGLTPECNHIWGIPDETERRFFQAKEAVNKKVYDKYGLMIDQLNVEEDVRYILRSDGTGYWQFSYWSRIWIGEYSHWACIFSLQEFDSEFVWIDYINPQYIEAFAIAIN